MKPLDERVDDSWNIKQHKLYLVEFGTWSRLPSESLTLALVNF